ncbi:MAG: hypothetical protein ACRD2U_04170 [Terriglobales bacterium]
MIRAVTAFPRPVRIGVSKLRGVCQAAAAATTPTRYQQLSRKISHLWCNIARRIASGQNVYLDFGERTPATQTDKHARFVTGPESPVRDARLKVIDKVMPQGYKVSVP